MGDIMSSMLTGRDVSQEDFDLACQEARDNMVKAGAADAAIADYNRQWKGGECPECGAAYLEIHVESTVTPRWKEGQGEKAGKVDYRYFEPGCDCYGSEDERATREARARNAERNAGIPKAYAGVSFERWDHEHASDSASRAKALAKAWFDDGEHKGKGLVLHGEDVGTGKTHCAVALLRMFAALGRTCRFEVTADLVHGMIKKGLDPEDLVAADVVVFDDIDKLAKTGNEWVAERVFSLFDAITREGNVLIATSNIAEPTDLEGRFGKAVASRLFGRCRFIKFEGSDYRLIRRGLEKGEQELWR